MKRRRAFIVTDLGFGDSGKGTTTDFLVRQHQAGWVVRHNGGAQAGHNVVLEDGRWHTFSQFGAATFIEGVRTHLSQHFVLNPLSLLREAGVLAEKGVPDALLRLSIHPQALVTSPFQEAANRLREIQRGRKRHGSCGLGIGETVKDSLDHPEEAIRAADFLDRPQLLRKLLRHQQRKWSEFKRYQAELKNDPQARTQFDWLECSSIAQNWLDQIERICTKVALEDQFLPDSGTVVCEGAQGVLLDEWRGFHPHTTWSTCTPHNARNLLEGWADEIQSLGVLRSYASRHGAGPFPSHDPGLFWSEPHNKTGPWQGDFRLGWLDLVLARYAIECCQGLDGLVLTHLDRVASEWKLCVGYTNVAPDFYDAPRLLLGPWQDLDYQQALTEQLERARPVYETIAGSDFESCVSERLGLPIRIGSRGPLPTDKFYSPGVVVEK